MNKAFAVAELCYLHFSSDAASGIYVDKLTFLIERKLQYCVLMRNNRIKWFKSKFSGGCWEMALVGYFASCPACIVVNKNRPND